MKTVTLDYSEYRNLEKMLEQTQREYQELYSAIAIVFGEEAARTVLQKAETMQKLSASVRGHF